MRDATRAEIQRLLRSLDGVREALAYDLDTAVAPAPQEATERPAALPRTSAAAAAIGRRRGDLHRARHSGLAAATSDRTDDLSRG